ncbi:PITH domain-containing protein At3g04780 [Linum perenne]
MHRWHEISGESVVMVKNGINSTIGSSPEADSELGPKTVKLFSNKEHMGFMYRISYSCFISQELSVSNVSSVWKPVALTYVKFQNVRSVTIFIEDNQSKGHVNKVQKIAFFGSTVETTDMKGLKKIEDH